MNIFDTIRDNGTTPTPVTEEDYDYALGVLPPIYAKGCFAISETYSGNDYYWFANRSPNFYAILGTRAEAEKVFSS